MGTWNYDGTSSGGMIGWPDGRQYQGDWKVRVNWPAVPEGVGTMTWPDGRKYAGEFRCGTMDGAGKMTYPDGRTEAGLWSRGQFAGETP